MGNAFYSVVSSSRESEGMVCDFLYSLVYLGIPRMEYTVTGRGEPPYCLGGNISVGLCNREPYTIPSLIFMVSN